MATCTTAHIERLFLTMRQEVGRLGRMTLAHSKTIDMHRSAVAMAIGIYNLVRKHKGLDGKTPAQAAGVEEKRWTLEDVVALTEAHWAPIYAKHAANKAAAKRADEDHAFAVAMTALEIL